MNWTRGNEHYMEISSFIALGSYGVLERRKVRKREKKRDVQSRMAAFFHSVLMNMRIQFLLSSARHKRKIKENTKLCPIHYLIPIDC